MKSIKELGISLVYVPHSWDKKLSSLRATIATIRPDVIEKQTKNTDSNLNSIENSGERYSE